MSHKTEDFKLSAVTFYLKNKDKLRKTRINYEKPVKFLDVLKVHYNDGFSATKNSIILHEIIGHLFPIKSKKNKSKLLSIFSKQMNKLP